MVSLLTKATRWIPIFAITAILSSGCGTDGISVSASKATPQPTADGIRMFGDSIFTSGGNMVERALEPLLQRAIDSHAVGGAVMWQIRDQYKNARNYGARTVIMDGGGNDVLGARGDCQNQLTPNCKRIVDNAVALAKEMFVQMKDDGVENIVHMGCHYPMNWNSGFVQAVDYSYVALDQACKESQANCVIVDTLEGFRGRSDLLEWDGVHPNWNGAQAFANSIWKVIQDREMQL